MSLTFNDQLRLRNIIDNLVYERGRSYDISLGREFRDLVLSDCNLKPEPGFKIWSPYGTSDATAYAPGVGNVKIDSEPKVFSFGYGQRLNAGKWEVFLEAGRKICIDERFSRTRGPEDQVSYCLKLNRRGEPSNFCKIKYTAVRLGSVALSFYHCRQLKKPVMAG